MNNLLMQLCYANSLFYFGILRGRNRKGYPQGSKLPAIRTPRWPRFCTRGRPAGAAAPPMSHDPTIPLELYCCLGVFCSVAQRVSVKLYFSPGFEVSPGETRINMIKNPARMWMWMCMLGPSLTTQIHTHIVQSVYGDDETPVCSPRTVTVATKPL